MDRQTGSEEAARPHSRGPGRSAREVAWDTTICDALPGRPWRDGRESQTRLPHGLPWEERRFLCLALAFSDGWVSDFRDGAQIGLSYSKSLGPVLTGAWFSGGFGFGGLVPRSV